jgi:uncharacterized membrane protein YfcA
METILVIAGTLLMIGSSIAIIIDAFHEDVAWGLLCLFVPPTQLVFVLIYWRDEKKRVFWMAVGVLVVLLGALFSPTGTGPRT